MTRGGRWSGALALASTLCACNPQAPAGKATAVPAMPSRTPPPAPLHITGHGSARQPVRVIQQVQNRIEYELISKSYESKGAQGKARAVFQDARVTFHDRNGKTLTATAPQAIVDEDANTVTMLGSVRAQTSDGMHLECDRLVYDHASQTLRGDGNVVVTDPQGFRGTGSSFESDISLTHMRMQ
jgi:LPS export ABC transporter protein LptC